MAKKGQNKLAKLGDSGYSRVCVQVPRDHDLGATTNLFWQQVASICKTASAAKTSVCLIYDHREKVQAAKIAGITKAYSLSYAEHYLCNLGIHRDKKLSTQVYATASTEPLPGHPCVCGREIDNPQHVPEKVNWGYWANTKFAQSIFSVLSREMTASAGDLCAVLAQV